MGTEGGLDGFVELELKGVVEVAGGNGGGGGEGDLLAQRGEAVVAGGRHRNSGWERGMGRRGF